MSNHIDLDLILNLLKLFLYLQYYINTYKAYKSGILSHISNSFENVTKKFNLDDQLHLTPIITQNLH